VSRTTTRILLGLALLAGWGPLAAARAAVAGPPVEGLVTADGVPLQGAEVRLLPIAALLPRLAGAPGEAPAPVAAVRTGSDGTFSLPTPTAGPWAVRVSKPGHLPRETVVEVLDESVLLAPVELPGVRTLAVTVVTPDGPARRGAVASPASLSVGDLPLDRWRTGAVVAPLGDGGRATLSVSVDESEAIQVLVPGLPAARFAPAGAATEVELTAAPIRMIEVVDGAGRPLPGVGLFDDGGPLPVAETDRSGRARLPSVVGPSDGEAAPADTLQLTLVTADGLVHRVEVPGAAGTWTVRLDPPRTVSGRVVERGTGRPLAGALVWSRPPGPGAPVRAGRDGRFELALPAAGRASLVAAVAGHRADSVPLRAAERVEIALAAARSAFGGVVDQEDRPVAGAEVRLTGRRDGGETETLPKRLGPFRTGADGLFEVPNPPDGRFDLTVEAEGYAPVTVPGVEIPGRPPVVDLGVVALSAGVEVAGRVVDGDGEPVEEARVLLLPVRSSGWEADLAMGAASVGGFRETRSDAEGGFRFPDLQAGAPVRLQARREGFVPSEPEELRLPEEGPVELVLRRPASVDGWVVDGAGRPVARALVTAERLPAESTDLVTGRAGGPAAGTGEGSPLSAGASAWTSPDGDFAIAGLQAGRWSVRASAPGLREGRSRPFEVDAGDEVPAVEVVLEEGATLSGRVMESDGAPAVGARVDLADGAGRPVALARVDDTGRFRLSGLPDGAHTLTAVAGDGREVSRPVDLGLGPAEVTLVLDPGASLRGRVVRADGAPVEGARVLLVGGGSEGGAVETRTDALGRFGWPALRDGSYHLLASAEGLSPGRGSVVVDGRPVETPDIVLDDGITLRGQVVGVPFEELPGVVVRVRGVAGAVGRPNYSGGVVLRNLPAGEVVVDVALEGTGRRAVERLELPAGAREVEATFLLPEAP